MGSPPTRNSPLSYFIVGKTRGRAWNLFATHRLLAHEVPTLVMGRPENKKTETTTEEVRNRFGRAFLLPELNPYNEKEREWMIRRAFVPYAVMGADLRIARKVWPETRDELCYSRVRDIKYGYEGEFDTPDGKRKFRKRTKTHFEKAMAALYALKLEKESDFRADCDAALWDTILEMQRVAMLPEGTRIPQRDVDGKLVPDVEPIVITAQSKATAAKTLAQLLGARNEELQMQSAASAARTRISERLSRRIHKAAERAGAMKKEDDDGSNG